MIRFKIENQRELGDGVLTATARAGVIKSSEIEDILTPAPMITSTEINKIDSINKKPDLLKDDLWIPGQVCDLVKGFKRTTLPLLEKKDPYNNKVFGGYCDELSEFASRFVDKLRILRISINKEDTYTDGIHNFMTSLAIETDVDCITAQDSTHTSSVEQFEKRLIWTEEKLDDEVRKHTKDILPILWMCTKENLFKQKVDAIINNKLSPIGVLYDSIYTYRPNYFYLRKIAEKEQIPILLFDAEKTWRGNKTTAMNHFLSLFSIDMVSLRPRTILPENVWLKIKNKPPKMLDAKTLAHVRYDLLAKCDCPVDNEENQMLSAEKYDASNLLPAYIRTHNTYVSHEEFPKEREHIINDDLKGYIKQKSNLTEAVKKVFGIDTSQRTFKEF